MDNDKNNNDNIKEWPIEPRFLSIRKGVNKYDKKSSYSSNKDGLFDANELRGILADASATLWEKDGMEENYIGTGQNFALFQVVPAVFDAKDVGRWKWFDEIEKTENSTIEDILGKRKILRIHPGKLYPNMNCCELFRKCDKGNCKLMCDAIDSRTVLLYDKKLPKINHEKDWAYFNDKLKEIITDYNKEIAPDLIEMNTFEYYCNGNGKENRPYVYYQCKYSRLMEYSFPIFHAGKVIAVLMHGQCFPSKFDRKEMFKEYRTGFGIFRTNRDKSRIELDKWIKKMDKEFFLNSENPMNKDRLEYVSKQIKMFEDKIQDAIKAKSQEYVSKKFYEIEDTFRKNINSTDIISDNFEDNLEDLGKKIEDIDKKIKNYSGIFILLPVCQTKNSRSLSGTLPV